MATNLNMAVRFGKMTIFSEETLFLEKDIYIIRCSLGIELKENVPCSGFILFVVLFTLKDQFYFFRNVRKNRKIDFGVLICGVISHENSRITALEPSNAKEASNKYLDKSSWIRSNKFYTVLYVTLILVNLPNMLFY